MASDPDPETSVCGALHEPLAFWRFRRVAGRADASRVAGIRDIERDRVVRMAEVEELMRVAHSRGARVLRQRELAHPFQDATRDIHLSRFQAVADFLAP